METCTDSINNLHRSSAPQTVRLQQRKANLTSVQTKRHQLFVVFHVEERVCLVRRCCLINTSLLGCWPPTLKMDADRSSEMHVNFKQNTRRHIPEDCSCAPNEACNFSNVHNAKVFYNFPANHKNCGKNIRAIKVVFHSALLLRSKQSSLLQIFIDAILRIPQTDA